MIFSSGLVLGLIAAFLVPLNALAVSTPSYHLAFENPPSHRLKLSTPTKLQVAVMGPTNAREPASGQKVTLTPDSYSPSQLTINGKPSGQAVTVTAEHGLASFTVEAVYHTGPVRLTATLASPTGPSKPVATFVTVGKGNPVLQTRYAGRSRYGTAAQLAAATDPKGAETVILSSGLNQNLVDALTAAPLSALLKAPILLTASNHTIGSDPLSAIKRLGARKVLLVGAVDNAAIKSQLPAGVSVAGYAGSNRYQTALDVARAIKSAGGNMSTLFFSSGENTNLTDALTIDPVAVRYRSPVLLLPAQGGLPAGYQALLKPTTSTFVIGAAASYGLKLPHAQTLSGVDRYSTAAAINQRFFPHPMGVVLTNADGSHLVDALTVGPLAGQEGFPIVMVSNTIIPGPTYDYLETISNSVSALVIAGGTESISSLMATAIAQMLKKLQPCPRSR